jgi:hypothetical protein
MASDRSRGGPTDVYLEVGSRRVFACALDWPGWARSGRTEELALQALADYAQRYAAVAERAGIAFPAGAGNELRVVERLTGSATTDFGAPDAVASADAEPVGADQAGRTASLLRASWAVFDLVAATAPAELRKGPRGGGRDRDKMVDHVLGAEASYARTLGVRQPQPSIGDRAAIEALRGAILAVLGAPSDGTPPVAKGRPVRYAARRIAWHVLDHAWEMQDRSGPSA